MKHLIRKNTTVTPFTSVSDSPARIIRYSKSKANLGQTLRVLVINHRKMHALGITTCRTTSLARALNVPKSLPHSPKSGLEFITDSHYLVDRWIPKECIEANMEFEDFKEFCKGRVDKNGKR